ncbi:MAG: 30S ribosomal protein S6, partial [Moraxellaceae bacterium]|nr:30S ribosomal protein S6 [Moraxellaceae bacterium]
DAVSRSLIIRREVAITEESILAKGAEEKRARKAARNEDEIESYSAE